MEKVRFLPLLMAGCVFISVSLPYIASVTLDRVHTFLPYISHAAAFPPHSALLSIFMAIGTFFGVPTFLLRYVSIKQKSSRLDPKKIRVLNTFALIIGILAAIAMLLASHYPIGFITHERYDWIKAVVIPHFTCTTLLITLYTVYVLIQAYLTYIHRKKSTKNVFIHATLAMCVVITNWTSCLPFYAAMREMVPLIIDDETGEISLESKEYSFYYIISSLSEWAFTFFSILFIATFYRDFKNMKLKLKVHRKPITHMSLDSVQTAVHSTFNGHDEITKM